MKISQHLSLAVALLSRHVLAHMEMSLPFPINSRYDPKADPSLIDYNLKSPLDSSGSNYPCHGYQNQRPIHTTASYVAGQSYSMTIAGSATHGGGSCQLSLSYDNGGTFKVIKSMIGGCPLTQSYTFTIPVFAPAGNALFAWTWFNEIGNREMYMNCAWVQITTPVKARRGTARRSLSRRADTFTSMQSLPNIWRANIDGLSTCGTVEGTDPVFPNPGPDVVYGSGKNANSPATSPSGSCDSAVPAGRMFQALGDTSNVPESSPLSSSPSSSLGPSSSSVSPGNTPSSSTTSLAAAVSTSSTFSSPSAISSSIVQQTWIASSPAVSPSSSLTSSTSSSLSSAVVVPSGSSTSSSLSTSPIISTSSSLFTSISSINVGGIFAPGAAGSPSSTSLSTTPSSLPTTSSTPLSSPNPSVPASGNTDHITSTIRITSTTTSTVTVELVSTALSPKNLTTSPATVLTLTIATSLATNSASLVNTSRPLVNPSLSATLSLTSALPTSSIGNSSLTIQTSVNSPASQLSATGRMNSSCTASSRVASSTASSNNTISSTAISNITSSRGTTLSSVISSSVASSSATTSSIVSSVAATSAAVSSTSVSMSASRPTSSIITIPDPTPGTITFTNLDFATPQNQSLYLPCVPGTLLCMSQFSFVICDQGPLTPSMRPSQVFKGPINVAAGMQCVPFLQKFVSDDMAGRFGGSAGAAPEGMYRSDRYLGLY